MLNLRLQAPLISLGVAWESASRPPPPRPQMTAPPNLTDQHRTSASQGIPAQRADVLVALSPAELKARSPHALHANILYKRACPSADTDCHNGYCCEAGRACTQANNTTQCLLGDNSVLAPSPATPASSGTAASTHPVHSTSSSHLSGGAIAGIVIGAVVCVLLNVGAVFLFLRRRRRRRRRRPPQKKKQRKHDAKIRQGLEAATTAATTAAAATSRRRRTSASDPEVVPGSAVPVVPPPRAGTVEADDGIEVVRHELSELPGAEKARGEPDYTALPRTMVELQPDELTAELSKPRYAELFDTERAAGTSAADPSSSEAISAADAFSSSAPSAFDALSSNAPSAVDALSSHAPSAADALSSAAPSEVELPA